MVCDVFLLNIKLLVHFYVEMISFGLASDSSPVSGSRSGEADKFRIRIDNSVPFYSAISSSAVEPLNWCFYQVADPYLRLPAILVSAFKRATKKI